MNNTDKLDGLINEFCRRNELLKSDDDHIVNDDTQVGIEFAYSQLGGVPKGMQLVSEKAISYLFYMHPDIYDEFYKRID
jgi:hypothetical protein